jgi:hypothetical protein
MIPVIAPFTSTNPTAVPDHNILSIPLHMTKWAFGTPSAETTITTTTTTTTKKIFIFNAQPTTTTYSKRHR